MNWNQELLNSAIWVAKAYAITLVVFVAVMALLARATVWGRQFWSLTGAYFSPRRSWRSSVLRQSLRGAPADRPPCSRASLAMP